MLFFHPTFTQPKKRLQKKWKTALVVLLSLILHSVLFSLFNKGLLNTSIDTPKQPEAVWVKLPPKEQALPIADIDKPEVESKPPNPSAQAKYDQTVKEETVAANSKVTPPSKKQPPIKKQPVGNGPAGDDDAPKKDSDKKKPPPPKKEPVKADKLEPFSADKKNISKEELYKQPKGNRIPGMPETSESAPGGDFLSNYKIGNRTYVNTQANPNIAYYAELKRRFRSTFNPERSLRGKVDPSVRSRVDIVMGVTVNAKGELSQLIVIRSSGVPTYDQECLRTIRSSAPFSAPPAHLLEGKSELNMAWTFTVSLR